MTLHGFGSRVVLGLGFLALLGPTRAQAQEACFVRLDNGVDMTGWHKSATNHHGPGDGWSIENGAFVGHQTGAQLGGIMMTDKSYQNVEVLFEVKIDWGCDSGFFFRTTNGDRSYQVNVDFLEGAGVGTIYGEGFTQELRYRPYTLTNLGDTAVAEANQTPLFDVSKWSMIWHKAEFNEMRARVEGNPPHLQVWIGDVKVTDFTDSQLRAEIDATGPLAIQVHGGAARWVDGGTVQFKNIRVRDLSLPCDEPDPGAGGAPADGGASSGGSAGSVSSAGSAGSPAAGVGPGGGNAGTSSAGGSSGGVPPSTIPNDGVAGSEPAPASSQDSGGCGCRTSSAGHGWAALALLFGWGALRLRRRAA